MTADRLHRGDYVHIRLNDTDEWTPAFVAMASEDDPASVVLVFQGAVRTSHGGLCMRILGLFVDYQAQKVTALHGDEYEVEVAQRVFQGPDGLEIPG